MTKLICMAGILALLVSIAGCEKEKAVAEEHAWQGQVDSIDKAREVEAQVMESMARQNQAIDEAVNGRQ